MAEKETKTAVEKKIKEEIKEVVEEEIEKKIPTSPETKTVKKKEAAAEKVAEEVAEEVVDEIKTKSPVKDKKKDEDEKESDKPKAETKVKKKDEKIGIACISSSSNNTIVHITDLAGNTISRVSGGMITKHSRLKANPTIAMFVAKRAAERANDLGFTKLYVRLKGKTRFGHGPGSNSAVKSLSKSFDLISILDTTKIPRGGPKKKGGRRGRRV